MANLFDDANAPETEPATIVAGDQVKWKRTDLGTDYPNTAYSLRYSSRLEGTGSTTFDVAVGGKNAPITLYMGESRAVNRCRLYQLPAKGAENAAAGFG